MIKTCIQKLSYIGCVLGRSFIFFGVLITPAATADQQKADETGTQYMQVVISEFGEPGVLHIVEHDTLPEPGEGEVRLRVLTASASFTDVMVRKGIYPDLDTDLPFSPGYDLVGIVDKVGEGVTEFTVGQRVADLTVWGAYTEYAIRPVQYLVPLPEGLDAGQAVSLILSYTTAYQMMHRVAQVETGQTVLIHGASGAVGMALAQLGQVAGLKMYGTASTGKQDFVAALGVTPIDYKTEDFAERIMEETKHSGVDVVFDAVSVDNFKRSYTALKSGGTLVVYGFYRQSAQAGIGESLGLAMEYIHWKVLQYYWNWLQDEGRSVPDMYSITSMRETYPNWFREDLAALFKFLDEGKIAPKVWKTLPLTDAKLAHEYIEDGAVEGKIVLRVSEDPDAK